MLIDTHCHLDLSPLADNLEAYLASASAAGVQQWVVPGIHPEGWERIAGLCSRHKALRPAFGIHPRHADEVTEKHLNLLEQQAVQGIAIGEVGLDRYFSTDAPQEQLFRRQIRIACNLGLPLLIHCRGMIGRTLVILREERAQRVGGIMHGYSGSVESAREFIQLGFAIALCATVTWPTAVKPLRLAAELPRRRWCWKAMRRTRIPARPRIFRNSPELLRNIAGVVARIVDRSVEDVSAATAETAMRVLPGLLP